jgi:hypothetical protein
MSIEKLNVYWRNKRITILKSMNLNLTVSNPYKYHSFSFLFHLASSLALKGGDSTERAKINNILTQKASSLLRKKK